jgi:hypothetical protein
MMHTTFHEDFYSIECINRLFRYYDGYSGYSIKRINALLSITASSKYLS